jgi:hypothetical protein
MLEWIGWIATAAFAASYLCKRPVHLRVVQALAAILWIGYGLVIGALPVIVANLVVATMASYSAWQQRSAAQSVSS